jgi:hypothetical protein
MLKISNGIGKNKEVTQKAECWQERLPWTNSKNRSFTDWKADRIKG